MDSYDTANGMSYCNFIRVVKRKDNLLLRYRERYELLQHVLLHGLQRRAAGYDTANGMSYCNSGASEAPNLKGSGDAFSKIHLKIADLADFGHGHCFKNARKMPENPAIPRLERVRKRFGYILDKTKSLRCLYYKAFQYFCQSFRYFCQ